MKKGSNRAKTVKLHEMELRKHRLKVKDQEKELRILSKENLELRQSIETLTAVHVSYMAAMADMYGSDVGDGAKELLVPAVNVQDLSKRYDVLCTRNMETKESVIRIEKKIE